jgi:predicted  nucleic acid-binding Zn ribbon protein
LPKKRDKNGEEFYRGKLREAQKQIRNLQRKVRELEKSQHMYEEILFDEEPEEQPKTCPECGKGHLTTVDIVGRVFDKCDVCGYRKKING